MAVRPGTGCNARQRPAEPQREEPVATGGGRRAGHVIERLAMVLSLDA
jgi:hypothetical protein